MNALLPDTLMSSMRGWAANNSIDNILLPDMMLSVRCLRRRYIYGIAQHDWVLNAKLLILYIKVLTIIFWIRNFEHFVFHRLICAVRIENTKNVEQIENSENHMYLPSIVIKRGRFASMLCFENSCRYQWIGKLNLTANKIEIFYSEMIFILLL